jgi:hypothetical protein
LYTGTGEAYCIAPEESMAQCKELAWTKANNEFLFSEMNESEVLLFERTVTLMLFFGAINNSKG